MKALREFFKQRIAEKKQNSLDIAMEDDEVCVLEIEDIKFNITKLKK
jgi:hypothetical protein